MIGANQAFFFQVAHGNSKKKNSKSGSVKSRWTPINRVCRERGWSQQVATPRASLSPTIKWKAVTPSCCTHVGTKWSRSDLAAVAGCVCSTARWLIRRKQNWRKTAQYLAPTLLYSYSGPHHVSFLHPLPIVMRAPGVLGKICPLPPTPPPCVFMWSELICSLT